MAKINAAKSAKAAKKNMRNAFELSPVDLICSKTAGLLTLASANNTHKLPIVTDRLQKLIMTPFIANGA